MVGAGCSFEAPTSLPLASTCSREAHEQLRADGVLTQDCPDPSDLSSVADAVYEITNRQRELVERLPVQRFRTARANEGYLLAAAMLREHAISSVVTLNFDLGMSNALTEIGAGDEVAIIAGPDDHNELGIVNLVYLHRNAYADAEQWILRTISLTESWMGRWEEVIVARFLTTSVTVFAGLGSPAAVLIESARRIHEAVGDASVYLVDPGDREHSAFYAALNIPEDAYLRIGWTNFMRSLSSRLAQEQVADLRRACEELRRAEGWTAENLGPASERLLAGGLLFMGRLRAHWLLEDTVYLPWRTAEPEWFADLLFAIALVERLIGAEAIFTDTGIVEFHSGGRLVSAVILAHGRGVHSWLALEPKLRVQLQRNNRFVPLRFALVAGIQGPAPALVTPPENIVAEEDPKSIIGGAAILRILSVFDIRQDVALVEEILN